MGRFSDALMNGAQDEKFQELYNYLIDLLNKGYSVEALINGQSVKIEISPEKILAIYIDGKQIGGIQLVNNILTSTIEAMMGANDKRVFIRIGDDPAMANADFMYGWYSATSTPPYTKRFKISEYNGGIELAGINDDDGNCFLNLSTYQTYSGSSVPGPWIELKGISAANGAGGYIEMAAPENVNGQTFKLIGPYYVLNDGSDQTGLYVFANNAAAVAGGVPIGGLYRTGADPDVVCIVH